MAVAEKGREKPREVAKEKVEYVRKSENFRQILVSAGGSTFTKSDIRLILYSMGFSIPETPTKISDINSKSTYIFTAEVELILDEYSAKQVRDDIDRMLKEKAKLKKGE